VFIYPLLSCLAWKWLQIGTDMLLLRNVNIDDLEWPWTPKILILSDFLAICGCRRVNCDKMDGDRPRLPANRNCRWLSRVSWALAQISCYGMSTYAFFEVSVCWQWLCAKPALHALISQLIGHGWFDALLAYSMYAVILIMHYSLK